MRKIKLVKETSITKTTITVDQEAQNYHGVMLYKKTGYKRLLGGPIAKMKGFLHRYYITGFERVKPW